jgi:hypothetical protein
VRSTNLATGAIGPDLATGGARITALGVLLGLGGAVEVFVCTDDAAVRRYDARTGAPCPDGE